MSDATGEAGRPKKRLRLWKIALWLVGGLLALIALLVAALIVIKPFREWTATRFLTDTIVRDRLAGTPTRTKSQPVRRLMVRARDGVELSTAVYLPEGEGPWPVIVVRDPYGFAQYITCKVWVQYDYACVYQEVRGRGNSKGPWYPFLHERKDGLDLLAWIDKQPWQNGRVALQGGSYLGAVQWAVAGDLPPEVKTMVVTVAHGDVYQLAYHNGAFNEGTTGVWMHGQFQPATKALWAAEDWQKSIAGHFPALGVDKAAFRQSWTPYSDYISNPDKDGAYWQSPEYVALREAHRKVQVPVFMIGFANDFFTPGMITTFEELPTRESSLFIIGPGNHGGQPDPEIAGSYTQDYADTLAWFDHHLRGAPLPARLRPGVNVFVHGDNAWRRFDRWPGASRSPMALHLDRLANAHACDGGLLAPAAPATKQAAQYVYDPRKPVPTRGGYFGLLSDPVAEQGSDLCSRPDVLSFGSAPFAGGKLINGVVRIRLRVSSDAPDTAFTVKLSERFADGRVYNIRDDISTLSMRNGASRRVGYKPGEEVEVMFDLTPILWRLKPGSSLRLDISSSSAPSFFPHPNRAGLWSAVADPSVARQSIYGGLVELPFE